MKESIPFFKNKYIIIATVAIVIIAVAAFFIAFGAVNLPKDTIAKGVTAGRINVSGCTKDEAVELINSSLAVAENTKIPFECDDIKFTLTASEIGLVCNADKMAEIAFNYAKDGNVFTNIINGYKAQIIGNDILPIYTCDNAMLYAAIDENLGEKVTPVTPYTVETAENKIIVTNSTGGSGVAEKNIELSIYTDLYNGVIDNTIKLTIAQISAAPIDIEEFISTYIRDAKDAQYSEQNGEYTFTPEIVGIEFDKQVATDIIEQNRNNTQPYEIPAKITNPDVTVKDLQSKFATDTLSTYSTNYASSDNNRASNVALAASKINGYVLNPGQRFSFNQVVGPRTSATGFKVAHVYEGDRVVDGMGGGICQVSSTLYNAVVLADLKIAYRLNHSMPVSYVPRGRDATVSYGTIDFVFENNKKYPVTISATTGGRVLTISIKGVNESDGVTVDITTQNAGYTAFSTTEVIDETLKPGETKVVKEGSNGSIVNSYKVYKKDGAVIKSEFLARSTYIPITKVVHKGPDKNPADPQPEQLPEQLPEAPETSEPEEIIQTPVIPEEPDTSLPEQNADDNEQIDEDTTDQPVAETENNTQTEQTSAQPEDIENTESAEVVSTEPDVETGI